MKLLIFNHSFFNRSETFIYKQVTGLPPEAEVTLMAFHFLHEQEFPVDCEKIVIQKYRHQLDRFLTAGLRRIAGIRLGFSLFTYWYLFRKIKQSGIQLVHVHFGFNAVLLYPVVRWLRLPLVVTFHGIDASPDHLKNPRYRRNLERIISLARSIVIVSPHMVETLGLHNVKQKTHLVPCGVDPHEFDPPVTRNFPVADIVKILHSGRLVSKKGVPDLLKVCIALCAKYPWLYVDIIGDGPEKQICEQLVQSAGTARIKLLGARTHEQVRHAMATADIFVLNSRVGNSGDMEGLPVSLLEAMSMQLAIVSTIHAGIPLAITHGADGLLIHEKDQESLYLELEKLILNQPLRQQLGVAARRKVQQEFTVERTNRLLWDLYMQRSHSLLRPSHISEAV